MAHGHGEFVHAAGDKYEGHWKRDKAHGSGKFIHVDGSVYDGDWKNDL